MDSAYFRVGYKYKYHKYHPLTLPGPVARGTNKPNSVENRRRLQPFAITSSERLRENGELGCGELRKRII